MKEQGIRFNRYFNIINGGVTSIAEIARSAAVPEKVALNELQDIIDYGHFPGAYIDFPNKEIIFQDSQNKNNAHITINHNSIKEKRQKAISCPHCGANVVVTEGVITQCEYCESPLSY